MNKFLLGALLVPMTLLVACGKQDKKTSSVKLGSEIDTVSYALGMSQAPTPEMIKGYLMQAGSDSAYVDAFFKGMKDGINAGDDKKEMAYQMGMQAGMNVKSRLFPQVEQQIFGKDSTQHLSGDKFLAGMLDGKNSVSALFDKSGVPYNTQTVNTLLKDLMGTLTAKANAKLYGDSKKKNEEFIKNMGQATRCEAPRRRCLLQGTHARYRCSAHQGPNCRGILRGRLMGGKVFDSSNGKTIEFPVGGVIPGFTTALLNMKVVPSGSFTSPGIKPTVIKNKAPFLPTRL